MSRIHEALKRAELERANSLPAAARAALPAPQEAGVTGQAASPAPENVAAARESAPPKPAEPAVLQFEDLVGRCRPHADWAPDPDTNVFSDTQKSHGAEQFRTLRSRLYHLRNHQALRTLLVTSSMAGEGKTFVTGNLARSFMGQSDRRVLVIDADLRRPRLHIVFGAPTAPGLTDYLRGTTDEASIIQYAGTGNLCLIPSGTRVSDPSELLSNGRMQTLLERLGPAFDWIIIDSPPCLPVADAGMIAHWCDGLLLVVRAGFTPSAVIARARQELKGRNVVGVVLNAVADDALAYGPYYGGYEASGVAGGAK